MFHTVARAIVCSHIATHSCLEFAMRMVRKGWQDDIGTIHWWYCLKSKRNKFYQFVVGKASDKHCYHSYLCCSWLWISKVNCTNCQETMKTIICYADLQIQRQWHLIELYISWSQCFKQKWLTFSPKFV